MRQLIIRGPITEGSGYSKALSAHLRHLAPFFDRIFCVDLTPPSRRKRRELPVQFEAIEDGRALDRAAHAAPTILFNYCIPDQFVRHPRAYNAGCFYWETDRFHPQLEWPAHLTLMDGLWLPSPHMRAVVERYKYQGRIFDYPWPQFDDQRPNRAAQASACPLDDRGLARPRVRAALHLAAKASRRFNLDRPAFRRLQDRYVLKDSASIRELTGGKPYYLSIFQAVPRKGLPILISEWLSFKKATGSDAWLVLKLSNIDLRRTDLDLYERTLQLLQRLGTSQGLSPEQAQVALSLGYLDEASMESLYSGCKAVISTSLGEGFGGPVAEAAFRALPVISPRHTSLRYLVPENYPFTLGCDELNVALTDQLSVYPLSAHWGVIHRENSRETSLALRRPHPNPVWHWAINSKSS